MRKVGRIAVYAAAAAVLLAAACRTEEPRAGEEPAETIPADAARPAMEEQSEVPPEFFQKKAAAGIDFFATGNEPSWVLDIDLDKEMVLKTMSGLELRVPLLESLVPGDDGSFDFEGVDDGGMIRFTVSKGDCVDTMSGEKFTHKVIVEVSPAGGADSQKFVGCGRHLAPIH